MTLKKSAVGNLLGAPRAEVDLEMLSQAFVETEDYRALISTRDFNFIVGRRGTGKSALFIKVSEFFATKENCFLFNQKPQEFEMLAFQSALNTYASDYRIKRAISRIIWKVYLLVVVLKKITLHWKIPKFDELSYLMHYSEQHEDIFSWITSDCCSKILRQYLSKVTNPQDLPSLLVHDLDINHLQDAVKKAFQSINNSAVFLFDGLDEGWAPNETATAVLGGLALAASDFSETKTEIYTMLFLRDNIFRSLAYFDPDFSRHIEGNAIRLRWDEYSLLHFIANRLRLALNISGIQSDVKVWNRFTQRDLKDLEGFKKCLQLTLFRPRDILVLLNQSYIVASRAGRDEIVDQDLEATSKQISQDRLQDLIKEYDQVFPGLNLFIEIFHGRNAINTVGDVYGILDQAMSRVKYESPNEKDFALLGTAKHVFFALYSVGFIGLENPMASGYIFCHDGSRANLDAIEDNQKTCIHPCYWKALEINLVEISEGVLADIHDEYQIKNNPEVKDLRIRMIGELISDIPNMPLGEEGAHKFEEWAFRAIKILFSGKLSNPELKPNKNAVQRRDIVATNMAQLGFWRRVYDDYRCRQVIFEIKNYESLRHDDFRQVLSYTTEEYGKFAIIVTRNEQEGLTTSERGWVKEMWDGHKRMIFVVPAMLMTRFITKLRNRDRFDYADEHLNRRLDTFTRSYLALKSGRQ